MNMRFKDCPEDLKQKLITLKTLSDVPEPKTLNREKIKTHSDILLKINALETSNIKEDLNIIADYLQNLEKADTESITKNMEHKLGEIERNMELYEKAVNDPLFFEELKEVYEILSGRFLQVKCNKGNKY